ncbi:hypothetical protein ABZ135_17295 [Streptomyces sp. NPDC006339]|uniref:hypothetical protein n=1 Tax=Streptomyces sp. NPDC006339 TaxID=3156755 RepID=UPI0033B76D8A
MRRDEDQPEEDRTERGERPPALRGEAGRRAVLGLADAVGPLLITLVGWWIPPRC